MKYITGITAFLLLTVSLYAESTADIIVFTKKGCSRCEYTVKYLKSSKITFIEYSIEDEANNSKMWTMIEQAGYPDAENITMPVIVKKGKAYFSIENLEDFVKKL